jgi:hypothetical protein
VRGSYNNKCRDTACGCAAAAVLVTEIVHLGACAGGVTLQPSWVANLSAHWKEPEHGIQAVLTVPQVACTRGLLLLEVQHSAEPALQV